MTDTFGAKRRKKLCYLPNCPSSFNVEWPVRIDSRALSSMRCALWMSRSWRLSRKLSPELFTRPRVAHFLRLARPVGGARLHAAATTCGYVCCSAPDALTGPVRRRRCATRRYFPLSAMALCRTHEVKISVLMFVVVPADKAQHPRAGFVQAGERPRELRRVLAGAEDRSGIHIAIAHARAAVGWSNPPAAVHLKLIRGVCFPGRPSFVRIRCMASVPFWQCISASTLQAAFHYAGPNPYQRC